MISSLARGVNILDILSQNPSGLRFKEINEMMGNISPTTLTKALKELEAERVIGRDENRAYRLGQKVFHWSLAVPKFINIVDLTRPELVRINEKFAVTACLFQRVQDRCVCLEVIVDPNSPGLIAKGSYRSMDITTLGSAFLLTPRELKNVESMPGDIAAEKSKLTLPDAKAITREALENDFYDDHAKVYLGNRRLAVPIHTSDNAKSILGVGVVPERLEDVEFMSELKKQMQISAKTVEAGLQNISTN